jgi:hypothetical protein
LQQEDDRRNVKAMAARSRGHCRTVSRDGAIRIGRICGAGFTAPKVLGSMVRTDNKTWQNMDLPTS